MSENLELLRAPGPDRELPDSHIVRCAYCTTPFDLFTAVWCTHADGPQPSKVCPSCTLCLCDHNCYGDDRFWKQAPPGFQRHGFRRLFLLYI